VKGIENFESGYKIFYVNRPQSYLTEFILNEVKEPRAAKAEKPKVYPEKSEGLSLNEKGD
jgi:hypothetical protein